LSHYFYDEESVDKPTKKLIQSQLEAQVQTKDQIQDDLRLSLQTEGNRQVLEEIKQGRVLDIKIAGKTNSQKNILKAYKTIEKWINRKGISDARLFYLKLNGEVNLIQITAASPEHARKIFQTINARGLGLDAIDIVKDILYQRTVQDLSESDRLFDTWEKMKSKIEDVDREPMRFFRYFLMASYETDGGLKNSNVTKWFEDNDAQIKYSQEPIQFVESLEASADTYRSLVIDHKCPDDSKSNELESITLLGGKSARQHLMVLLAGEPLPTEHFNRLVRNLEVVLFYSLLTAERSQTLEKNMLQWSKSVRAVCVAKNYKVLDQIYDDMAETYKEPIRQFEDRIRNVEWQSSKDRLRYFLAKINSLVDRINFPSPPDDSLRQYATAKSYHVEHILPLNPSKCLLDALNVNSEIYEINVNKLGNLMLLDGVQNVIASNKPYSEKISSYKKSNLLMVRHMVGEVDFSEDTVKSHRKSKDIANELRSFEDFTIESIDRRQEMLLALTKMIWYLPHD